MALFLVTFKSNHLSSLVLFWFKAPGNTAIHLTAWKMVSDLTISEANRKNSLLTPSKYQGSLK